MVVDIQFSFVHLHDDETQKQSSRSSAEVKTDRMSRAIGEIKNPQAFKNKIKTRFTALRQSSFFFFSGHSKLTSFLSPFQPFGVKAV